MDLPLELMEQILRNLPVGCIKSLKLVNKHMSVAVLGPCLHSFLVCQSTNLTPSSVSSLELLLRNDVTLFGRHVRHVRVMAETFAIASAENMLATGLRHPTESTLTNRHGDNFVVQLDKPMIKYTRNGADSPILLVGAKKRLPAFLQGGFSVVLYIHVSPCSSPVASLRRKARLATLVSARPNRFVVSFSLWCQVLELLKTKTE